MFAAPSFSSFFILYLRKTQTLLVSTTGLMCFAPHAPIHLHTMLELRVQKRERRLYVLKRFSDTGAGQGAGAHIC